MSTALQHLLAASQHFCPLPGMCGRLLMTCDLQLHILPVRARCCLCCLLRGWCTLVNSLGCCLVLKPFMTPLLCCLNGMTAVPAWRFSLLQAETHNGRLPAALPDAPSVTAVL